MKTTYHIPMMSRQPDPKRGDLLQSNIGKRTERTWLVLRVKGIPVRQCKEMGGVWTRRFKIWGERWWDLEPETRIRLWRSAERAGGQELHTFYRFPAKKKAKTFEQYMAEGMK
jgi:hypothetical protein